MDTSRIIELAKKQGKSITFICSVIGKPKYYLNNLKNKNLSMPAEFLEKIAIELNTTPSYLLGETTTSESRDLLPGASVPFWSRFAALCGENQLGVQSEEISDVTGGIPASFIMGWSRGTIPSIDVVCSLATFFDVSVDYLLGISGVRKKNLDNALGKEELELLSLYKQLGREHQVKLLATAYNYRDFAKKTEAKGRNGEAV